MSNALILNFKSFTEKKLKSISSITIALDFPYLPICSVLFSIINIILPIEKLTFHCHSASRAAEHKSRTPTGMAVQSIKKAQFLLKIKKKKNQVDSVRSRQHHLT